jgi:hypothetical protein
MISLKKTTTDESSEVRVPKFSYDNVALNSEMDAESRRLNHSYSACELRQTEAFHGVAARMRKRTDVGSSNSSNLGQGLNNSEPSNFPLALVLTLTPGMPPARLELLGDMYGPHFERVLFLVYDARSGSYAGPPRQKSQIRECDQNRHMCVSLILSELQQSDSSIRGSLILHADFWFRSDILRDFDTVWMTEPGLSPAPKCVSSVFPEHKILPTGDVCLDSFEALARDFTWNWRINEWCNNTDDVKRYKEELWEWSTDLAKKFGAAPVVCAGWSDLYYLPRPEWTNFASMANESRNTFHGVAIPSIIAMFHSRPSNPATVRKIQCAGGCQMNGVENPEDYSRRFCGHRLNLANSNLVEAYRGIWQSLAR